MRGANDTITSENDGTDSENVVKSQRDTIVKRKKENFEDNPLDFDYEEDGDEDDDVIKLCNDSSLSDAKDEKKLDTPKAISISIDHVIIIFKSVCSVILLIFSVVTTLAVISFRQTNLSNSIHPAFAYVVLIGSISWLTTVEGSQASLVGLAPVNKELYRDTHEKAYKCTSITNWGDNLNRYLLGRQLIVVLIIFCVNMSAGPIDGATITPWGFPIWFTDVFFNGGLAMTLITCMIGQLNSQVNASHCMLDYINNYFALFTVWVAMAIEFSGVLHSSYLVAILIGVLTGQPIESKEEPRSRLTSLFFWFRCLLSLAILLFSIVVTLVALFAGKTTMWESIPPGAAVVVFIVLMSVVGILEGMQIAFFAAAKLQESERGSNYFAKKTCELLYAGGDGDNLPRFMIGRQLCVVSCMLFVARITNIDMEKGDEDVNNNLFGVSDGVQSLLNTGLLGAIMSTILGSISWQLVASAFPIAFLSNPLTYILLRICLLLEATGICQGAWVLAAIHKKAAGFQRDEVYIGTAEERAELDDDKDTTICLSSSRTTMVDEQQTVVLLS